MGFYQAGVIGALPDAINAATSVRSSLFDSYGAAGLNIGTTFATSIIIGPITGGIPVGCPGGVQVSIGKGLDTIVAGALNVGATTATSVNIGRANQSIGFFGAGAVTRQSTTGTTQQTAAGAGAAVKVDSTSTGGTGAAAYTTADVILALKNYGLLAA